MDQLVNNLSNTDAMILCGGMATRLRNVVSDRPKILADINGVPFIELMLGYLQEQGVSRVILCTGYEHEQIEQWIEYQYGGKLDITFSREEFSLGTGGAVKNAEDHISGERFLVLNGDTFLELNYSHFLSFFIDRKLDMLIALAKATEASQYGTIQIDGKGKIETFEEKIANSSKHSYINAGVYLFSTEVLEHFVKNCKVSLEYEVIPLLLEHFMETSYGFESKGVFIDIGTPERYQSAQDIL